jgi:putative peptidoglycan lipid II flippase
MNLLRALATVSGMTLLSRILGFVRDFVIARSFGAGMMTDAFFVAFRLPNLLRRLFAEGAFSQAFVPILAEYRNRRGEAKPRASIDRVASVLFLILIAVSALGMAAAPLLIAITAPGFAADAEKFQLTVELTRITFPYILFMSLVALAAGILNTWSRFALPAFTPCPAQPVLHRHGAVRRALVRSAGHGPGLGGLHRRRAATGDPDCRPWRRSACCRASPRSGATRACKESSS